MNTKIIHFGSRKKNLNNQNAHILYIYTKVLYFQNHVIYIRGEQVKLHQQLQVYLLLIMQCDGMNIFLLSS